MKTLLIFLYSFYIFASNLELASIDFNSINKVSKKDLLIAKLISETRKNLITGKRNKNLLKSLLNNLESKSSFLTYKPYILFLNELSTSNMFNRCLNSNLLRSHTKSVSQNFINEIRGYCYKNAIENLTQETNNKNIYKFFLNYLDLVIKHDHFTSNYFKKLKKNESMYKKTSRIIIDIFIHFNKIPSNKLVNSMHVNSKLTKYLNIYGPGKNSVGSVLLEQYQSILASIENSKSKKRPYHHAKNFLDLNNQHMDFDKVSAETVKVFKKMSRDNIKDSDRLLYHLLKVAYKAGYTFNESFQDVLTEFIVYQAKDNKKDKAYKLITNLNLLSSIKQSKNSKLKYWTADVILPFNKKLSKQLFDSTIKANPLSFYAIMSSKTIENYFNIDSSKYYKGSLNLSSFKTQELKLSKDAMDSLKRLSAWAQIKDMVFVKRENIKFKNTFYKDIQTQDENKLGVALYILSIILNHHGHYIDSFKNMYWGLSNQLISLNQDTLKLLFPKPYLNYLSNYANNFDPLIALSLIRQESGFNPMAKSSAGARGLMQLMPRTARSIRRGVRTKKLNDPITNMKIGTKYFNKLLKKFDNNLVYSLAAYNAGETRVQRWKERKILNDQKPIMENIESIPFNETKKYVKLIFRNIFFYKLMNSQDPILDVPKKNQIFNVYLGFNS